MKYFLWIVAIVMMTQQIQAAALEGTVSCFFPQEKILREIYGSAWVNYGIELNRIPVPCMSHCRNFGLFAGIDYMTKDGKSLGGNDDTRIQVIPLTLGVRWLRNFWTRCDKTMDFYLGLAPRYSFLRIHDHTSVGVRHIYKSQIGIYTKLGILVRPCGRCVLDVFASGTYTDFSSPNTPNLVSRYSLQLCGVNVGGGIGFIF